MTGTVKRCKNGIVCIEGDDGATYYGVQTRRKLRKGTEVGFKVNEVDYEVADKVMCFGINPEYSRRDNLISLAVGLIIGAAAVAFLLIKPVHAEPISEADKALLVQIVHAESGNQDLLGRRLVADVVLNRVEHEDFPDTIKEVIYQPGQFQPAHHLSAKVDDMDILAVELELSKRTNNTVLYFRTGRYHSYGEPHFKVGDHYFS